MAFGNKVKFFPLSVLLPDQWETKDIPLHSSSCNVSQINMGAGVSYLKCTVMKKQAYESCEHAMIAQGSLYEEHPMSFFNNSPLYFEMFLCL